MSVSLWNYSERCDGDYCCGDCDHCSKANEEESAIKLIIDIPEKIYNDIKSKNEHGLIFNAVKNGTPLPKGHGDLIDRRELKKEVYTTTEWNGDIHRIIYEASVDDVPTIIEADKEE